MADKATKPLEKPHVLRPQQEAAVELILQDKSHICAAKTGAGKTNISVEAILRSGVKVAVVVAPLNTVAGWRTTVARQSQGEMPFHVINSKKAGTLAFQALTDGERGVYFVGTEFFRRLFWKDLPIDFMVIDENHRFANRKAVGSEVLHMQTSKVEYKLALSATPAGNKIEGLWSTMHWLWPETYRYFWPWVGTWLKAEILEVNGFKTKKINGEREPGAVWESLPSKSKFASAYSKEPVIHEIEVEMTPAQAKLYNRFEKEAVVWLDDNPLAERLPAVQAIRLREMTLAVPSIKQDWIRVQDKETGLWSKEWGDVVYFKEDAKSSKLDALIELLDDLHAESPIPVLVFCHSRKFVEIVERRLFDRKFNVRRFVGGMSPEEREWKRTRFGHDYEVMVATIPTVAEGTDGLQEVCHHEVWLSVSDNRVLNTQAIGRLSRQGQTQTVQRYYIRTHNSVETRQISRLATDAALLAESLEQDNDKNKWELTA